MLTKKQARVLTKRLDKIANHVEKNFKLLGMSRKAAYNFCMYLDQTSDVVEKTAGLDRRALTLERDPDEAYMDTFNSPKGPVETDPDEPYMMEYEKDNDSQLQEDDDLTPMNDGDWEVESGENWYDGDDDWY